jgi:hypothetical protein
MVTLTSLWMPILLAAVLSFAAGSVMHLLIGHHRRDFRAIPNEASGLATLTSLGLTPGDYFIPLSAWSQPSTSPITAVMTVMRPGGMKLASCLAQWFIYQLIITILCAYVASRTLPMAAPYLGVFRVIGTVAFMAYSVAYAHDSIWWHRSWGITLRYMFDGLVYALLTAGVFGWLWPR